MMGLTRAFLLALASAFTLMSSSYAQLTQLTPVYGSYQYNIEISEAPARVAIENMNVLPARDDGVDYIPLPFNFVFYNRSYSSLNASANGNIQFRTAATGYTNSLFGQGGNLFAPVIATFFTDLYPNTLGQRTWIVQGTAPNRQFLLRFTDVNYCCTLGVADRGLSMDVILTETTNTIDIRYYRVLAGTRNIEIGVQDAADGNRWAYIWNDVPMLEQNITLFTNKNVRFNPVNQPANGGPIEPIVINPIYNSYEYTVETGPAPARPTIAGAVDFPAVDDAVHYVPLPFNFVFYNRSYWSVNASTNGNVQFTTASTGSANAFFGPTGTNSYAPVIAAFHTNLYPTTAGQRTWAVQGVAPNRQFFLRFNDVGYCCTAGGGGRGLDMDIVLFETSHYIEIRYYRVAISQTTTVRNVEIGLQNSGSGNAKWVALWNDMAFNEETVTAFENKVVRFVPVNQDPNGVPPQPLVITPVYSTRSYDVVISQAPAWAPITGMTNLSAVDDGIQAVPIGFSFVFYNRSYSTLSVSSNGNIQFVTAASGYTNSLFGQTASSTYTPIIAAFFTDLYPTTLGQRTYITQGVAPNRQFIVRFNDVNYCCTLYTPGMGLNMEIVLTETTNMIDIRYYRIPAGTRNVEMGIQNADAAGLDWVYTWNDEPIIVEAVLAYAGKNIRYSPNNQPSGGTPLPPVTITPVLNSPSYQIVISDAPAYAPIANLVNITAADDAVHPIPIGFTFNFYNRSYTDVGVSTNGNLQFVTRATGYSNSLFGQTTAATYAPVIAAYFADLYPTTLGQRTYITQGSAPNRQLIVRFTDVNFCCSSLQPGTGLSFEIVLTETTNTIDVRYYRVVANTRTIEMGVQNSVLTDWAYIWNDAAVTLTDIPALQGKNVRYNPVNQPSGQIGPGPVDPVDPDTITPVYNSPSYTAAITTAPALATGTFTNMTAADDGVHTVPIGFTFNFYNRSYTEARVSTNGNIQFSTSATSYSNALFGQAGTAANALTPIIAAFFTDLYPTTAGQRTYATIGAAPNRQFIARFTDVNYCCTSMVPGVGLSMDIVLHETTNLIDLRYYRTAISQSAVIRNVEIGLQNSGNNDADWAYVWNDLPFTPATVAAFNLKQVRWTPVNQPSGQIGPGPVPLLTPVYNSPSYTAEMTTAPALSTAGTWTNITAADDAVHIVPIGFPFMFYNLSYTDARVSTNGNIQFATSATGYSNSLFGQGTSASLYAPVIAAFFSDLYPTTLGQRTYSLSGAAPNRQFTVRFTDVWYCCTSYRPGVGLSMDIVFHETTNIIDLRYYRIPISETITRNVEIGLQNTANNFGDWAYIWNDMAFDTTTAALLTNKQVRWTPSNQNGGTPPVPVTITPVKNTPSYDIVISQAPALAPIPNMINLAAVDDGIDYVTLGWNFVFYNISYTEVVISSNGNIQFATASTGYSNSLFGQGATANGYSPIIAAFFADLYPTTAGQRTYIITGAAPSRQLIVRFNDVEYCCTAQAPGAATGLNMEIVLTETTNTIDIRYYRLAIGTRPVEIGIQNAGMNNADWAYLWNDAAITSEANAAFMGKNVRFNPVAQGQGVPVVPTAIVPVHNTPSYRIEVSTSPSLTAPPIAGLINMTAGDDIVTGIQIGFPFVFYNRSYEAVGVAANGNLQFLTTSTGFSNSLFGQSQATSYTPIIAAFFADLYPTTLGQRTYATTGTAPNRQLTVRFTDVGFCCSAIVPGSGVGLSMDIILYETSNIIDVRYFRVPLSGTRNIEIGVQNSGMNNADWAYIWNDQPINRPDVLALTGKQVRYNPVNQAAGGIPIEIVPTLNSNEYRVDITAAPALAPIAQLVDLPAGDDMVNAVAIGFDFTFYGRTFNRVNVSSNGNLQFMTGSTGYSNALFGQTSTATAYEPIIAFFFADLYPTTLGQIKSGTIGSAPNRQFIVRFTDVNFCCSGVTPGVGLSVDVVLTEGLNTVDLRYYRIPVATNRVEIGLQNSVNQWVHVWNDEPFSPAYAGVFTNKQVRFAPPGTPLPPSSTAAPQPTAPTAPTAQPTTQPTGQPTGQPTAQPGQSSSTGSVVPVDDSSKSSSLSGGAIAGIVIGVIVGVLILAVFCFFVICGRRGDKHNELRDEPSRMSGGHDDSHQQELEMAEHGETETV